MEAQNLQTAAHYVNNLLLSRGLLRNGEPIEFTKCSSNSAAANIINLVHDLVLRRDRETESLTGLSQTLSHLRNTSTQQAQSISKLETRNADLERQFSLAQAQERTAKASLKTTESRNKALREEMIRLKSTVNQIRAQCANEVRKRDTEMKRLQKYLEVRRGREGSAPVGVTVITPGVSKADSSRSDSFGVASTENPAYSLKEETTEFLTQLSQSLSDENDALINLVQMTLATLRSLQGLPEPSTAPLDADGAPIEDPNISTSAPPSYENLATDMDDVLEHLRSLLTNPSFVPLEEVQVREEEIVRLREGFERMESKLKEALGLMNAWRKRMMESGDTVNLDDLREGLNIDASNLSKSTWGAIKGPNAAASKGRTNDSRVDEDFKLECELAANQESPLKMKPDLLFPAPEILRNTSGNTRRSPTARKVSFHVNSPKIGALMESLANSDDVALLDAEGLQYEDENNEAELSVAQKLDIAKEEAQQISEKRKREVSHEQPVKRSAIPKKVRSKRRSTLRPEELERLMGV